MRRMILTTVAGLLLATGIGIAAEEQPAFDLGKYIGTWETKYDAKEGKKEVWTLSWNAKKTYIDFRTETWVNGSLDHIGKGFLFYAKPEADYRMYLMMDNGALHESIGKETKNGGLLFVTKTYGSDFPDHDTVLEAKPGEMKVIYVLEHQGKEHRVEQVFTQSES